MIVDELIVVDPKVVTAFDENHMAQMIRYLAKTELNIALLPNFKYAQLKWKRVAYTASPPDSHIRAHPRPSAVQVSDQPSTINHGISRHGG